MNKLTVEEAQKFHDHPEEMKGAKFRLPDVMGQLADSMREVERMREALLKVQTSLEYYPAEKNTGVIVALEAINEALSSCKHTEASVLLAESNEKMEELPWKE